MLMSSAIQATTYYVSYSDGSDSDSGLTEGLAWKTSANINAGVFIGGDQIKFKCGDTWNETFIIPSSGSVGNPIIITSYGTGAKPIFSAPVLSATWAGSGVYTATVTISQYSLLWEDGKELKYATSTACTDGNWFDVGSTLYYKPTSGTPANHVLNCANLSATTSFLFSSFIVSDRAYITLYGLEFRTTGGGIISYDSGVGTNSITIYDCAFYGCSRAIFFMPDINDNRNAVIRNNYFKWCQNAVGMYTSQATNGNPGDPNYQHTHGFNIDFDISYNEMDACGTTDGTTIWTHGTDLEAIGLQNTTNGIVHHNYIHDGQQIGFEIYTLATRKSTNTKFYQNRIENTGTKIPIQITGQSTLGGFTGHENIQIHTNIIKTPMNVLDWTQGNTPTQMSYFYNNTGYCSTSIKIYAATNTAVYLTAKNNIFTNLGTYAFRCDANATNLVLDNNIYNQISPSATPLYLNGAFRTLVYMQGLGYEINGQTVDPLLVSASDFNLQSNSLAIDAGVNVGLTSDYRGYLRTGLPDIGAYEYNQTINPTGKKIILRSGSKYYINPENGKMYVR